MHLTPAMCQILLLLLQGRPQEIIAWWRGGGKKEQTEAKYLSWLSVSARKRKGCSRVPFHVRKKKSLKRQKSIDVWQRAFQTEETAEGQRPWGRNVLGRRELVCQEWAQRTESCSSEASVISICRTSQCRALQAFSGLRLLFRAS